MTATTLAKLAVATLLGLSAMGLGMASECKVWYYWGSVQIYHENPTRLDVETISPGFIEARDEDEARMKVEDMVRDEYSGRGDIVTPMIEVECPERQKEGPRPPGSFSTPDEPRRGTDGKPHGNDGGNPERLVIPKGVQIKGVWVYAGRRVDGFVFEGSNGKHYGFKGTGSPDPKYIAFKEGEHITGFRGVSGDQWDRVWIITNRGEHGGKHGFGGDGGSNKFRMTVPEGKKFIGMHGRVGTVIDKAGLVYE